MVTALINRPCTVVERAASTTRDGYGNREKNDSERETVCELQQRSRGELSDQTEVAASDWVAFFRPCEELDRAFQVIVDGQRFEIIGQPWKARNPRTQKVEHIEASLQLVEAGKLNDS